MFPFDLAVWRPTTKNNKNRNKIKQVQQHPEYFVNGTTVALSPQNRSYPEGRILS
jgi:hypothetical protein